MKDDIDARCLANQFILVAHVDYEESGAAILHVMLIEEKKVTLIVVNADDFTRRISGIRQKLSYQLRADRAARPRHQNRLTMKQFAHDAEALKLSRKYETVLFRPSSSVTFGC